MQPLSYNPLTRAQFSQGGSHSLAVIGHLAIDSIIHPEFQLEKVPGGSAAAVATASVQLGIDCAILSMIGKDFPKDWLWVLENLGIDITSVRMEEKERSPKIRMTYKGSGELEDMVIIDLPKEGISVGSIPRTEAIHICPLPCENQLELVGNLRKKSEILSINFSEYYNKDYQEKDILNTMDWSDIDLVFLNKKEASALTGETAPEKMARKFLDKEVDIVAITQGRKGVLVIDENEMIRAGSEDVKVVDPTGCGDSFIGGFLGEFLKSGNIKKAQGIGSYMASLTVQKKGAWAALMTDVGTRF
jgi:sugar/nucleoside kinase (ribokinase family)